MSEELITPEEARQLLGWDSKQYNREMSKSLTEALAQDILLHKWRKTMSMTEVASNALKALSKKSKKSKKSRKSAKKSRKSRKSRKCHSRSRRDPNLRRRLLCRLILEGLEGLAGQLVRLV